MASTSEIQELAMQLSLSYTAKGAVDLHNEKLSNLDYLKYVLESELAERNKAAIQRKRAESRLPRIHVTQTPSAARTVVGGAFCVWLKNS